MSADPHADVRVSQVRGRGDRRRFVRLPWSVYAADETWIPPLLLERQLHLAASNPYFQHADWCAWLAWRGRSVVGRISAQIDHLYLERHQDATGFFGMLEAQDDAEVFARLLGSAEAWLRQQGMGRVRGPFNFSINDESGLLVEGLEHPPAVMMGHARPYYAGRVEAQGYAPAKDLLAYWAPPDYRMPPVMEALFRRAARQVRLRPLQR